MKATSTLLLLFIALVGFTNKVSAQTSTVPFSFQGYAIDPDGKALTSTDITVKFSINNTDFVEEVSTSTDAFGVFHALVGATNPDDFKQLDFSDEEDLATMKVEVKKTSGGSYTVISNTTMNAVPYAKHASNGVPVGTIVSFAGPIENIPTGWRLCNGDLLKRTDFPALFEAIGNAWGGNATQFHLPDLRGMFLRGVDHGKDLDKDRGSRQAINIGGNVGDNVGSWQGSQFSSHKHDIQDKSHDHTDATTGFDRVLHWNNGKNYATALGEDSNKLTSPDVLNSAKITAAYTGITETKVQGGSETRSVNVNVEFIIKY